MTEREKFCELSRKLKVLSSLLASSDLAIQSNVALRKEIPVVLRNIASEINEAWDQCQENFELSGFPKPPREVEDV